MSKPRAHIITASAGAGKTYQLAYKYIYDALCDRPIEGKPFRPDAFEHTLAVTFTNKATQEMKNRILKRLNELATNQDCPYTKRLVHDLGISETMVRQRAAEVRSAILHNYSRFAIMTNDTFFQRIMRSLVREIGAEPNYAIELDPTSIISRSADAMIAEIDSEENGELQQWMHKIIEQNIEKGNKWDIRNEILRLQSELFKEQGDTMTKISSKAELEQLVGPQIKASEELVEQMQKIAAEVVDEITRRDYLQHFKGKSRGFINYFWKVAAGDNEPMSNTTRYHLNNDVEEWCGSKKMPADFIEFATELQKKLQSLAPYCHIKSITNLLRQNYHSFALMNDLHDKALEICREENLRLISETKQTIGDFIADSDVPFIYEKMGNTFERFMIDEFQDTSLREWKNFLPLLRNAMAQSIDISTLLVGDIKQSIYRWRGSDWNILGHIAPEDIKKSGTSYHHETLTGNYRSLPKIVDFNNQLFSAVVKDENTRLNAFIEEAKSSGALTDEQYNNLHNALANAYQDHTQISERECKNEGYVCITAHDKSSAPDIVGCIHQAIDRGYRPCDIAILIRVKREAYRVADTLLAANQEVEDERYKFDIMTEEALLIANSPAVRFITAVMRLATDSTLTIERAIYNHTLYGDFMHRESDSDRQLFEKLQSCSAEEAFEEILMRYGNLFTSQIVYIEALHEAIVQFAANKSSDLHSFLKWWNDHSSSLSVVSDRNERSVEIMTIHKAKGLEKKVIIIPFCDWSLDPKAGSTIWAQPSADSELAELGYYPINFSKQICETPFANAYYTETVYNHIESLNLLYVALTRAAEELHIFLKIPSIKEDNMPYKTVNSMLYHSPLFHFPKEKSDVETLLYTYGTASGVEPFEEEKSDVQTVHLTSYASSPIQPRLATQSSRYAEENVQLSPRDKGILLHQAMEHSQSADDIIKALNLAALNGIISSDEHHTIVANVQKLLSQAPVCEWFDGSWQIVRNEQSIIDPALGIKRPDRVMINGKRALVIDYKFGKAQTSHRTQIAEYGELLRKMGYEDIRGYIWYVRDGKIDEVSI
ncbi:MAG: UvrD-helicase domain-containing protein [Alistipes sp.]|nr:UvrD-helicase domain-containing protein [Alistipes sp.]